MERTHATRRPPRFGSSLTRSGSQPCSAESSFHRFKPEEMVRHEETERRLSITSSKRSENSTGKPAPSSVRAYVTDSAWATLGPAPRSRAALLEDPTSAFDSRTGPSPTSPASAFDSRTGPSPTSSSARRAAAGKSARRESSSRAEMPASPAPTTTCSTGETCWREAAGPMD